MEELLKRLTELGRIFEAKIKEADDKIDEYNRKVINLKAENEAIIRRIKELDDRELRIKPIEDVAAMHREAKELADKGAADLKESIIKINALGRESNRLAEINQQKTIEANDRLAKAVAKEAELDQREAKLLEDIKNYKIKVKEELKKSLG